VDYRISKDLSYFGKIKNLEKRLYDYLGIVEVLEDIFPNIFVQLLNKKIKNSYLCIEAKKCIFFLRV
jgi:hypothetical protein